MIPIKRQLLVFGTLVLCGLTGITLFMAGIHGKSNEINNNWLPSVIHVSNINKLTSDFRINELQHILSLTNDQMNAYESEIAHITDLINGELRMYEPLITTPLEKTLYADFVNKWNEYLKQHRQMVGLSRENRNEEAKILIRDRSDMLFKEYSLSLKALVAENRHLAHIETAEGRNLLWLSIANILLILGLVAYAAYMTVQYIKKMFDKVITSCVSIMTEISV
ncbi:MCP four helix bundle domain-containing protein [bacterium]|nr:MCP four helix bundle domain-containing protein [bacterium]